MANPKDIALPNTILRGEVGSTVHQTGIPGGEDRDEMGIFIEPKEYVLGLEKIEQYKFRTAGKGQRSGPGDLDLIIYSLRKFIRLAVKGNPSTLLLLWTPEDSVVYQNTIGMRLRSMKTYFHSQESGKRFLGYLISQRQRLTGEKSHTVSRPELVTKFGYDTKFAMHALRLGYTGAHYMKEKDYPVPLPKEELAMCQAVRRGDIPLADVLTLIKGAEDELRASIEKCDTEVNRDLVNRFLIKSHLEWWNGGS